MKYIKTSPIFSTKPNTAKTPNSCTKPNTAKAPISNIKPSNAKQVQFLYANPSTTKKWNF